MSKSVANIAGGFAAEQDDQVVLFLVPAKLSAKDLDGLSVPAELVERVGPSTAASAGSLRLKRSAAGPTMHVLAVGTDGKVKTVGRKRKLGLIEASIEPGSVLRQRSGSSDSTDGSAAGAEGVGPVGLALPAAVPAPPAETLRYRARPIGSKPQELKSAPDQASAGEAPSEAPAKKARKGR